MARTWPDSSPAAWGPSSRTAICVLVGFTVAFCADDLVEDDTALAFPGEEPTAWDDCVYLALSVMTTFGTTDVTVLSRETRRTVAADETTAFVFSTVVLAGVVAALDSGWGTRRVPVVLG
ncbi:DUF1345 domain-containing protein [Streptomyces hydrogenans]|uniref:DUF1345 domain-containing protein n=1 Tax=Streptomyces hydrogenans TaxID=1873719 RepID=UPI0037F9C1BC